MSRIVEAYIGEYASGKSENAVNRALELAEQGRQVNLVDLDLVEPCYTLRPLKRLMAEKGVTVLAWETKELLGLGETGNILKPEVRFCLRRPGDVIIDVGYGAAGAQVFNLIEDAWRDPDLMVIVVINVARPMTATAPDIVAYVSELGRVDGLINNSHLGDETDLEIIQKGIRIVGEAAQILEIPVIATTVMEELAPLVRERGCLGYPVRVLKRYMPRAFW